MRFSIPFNDQSLKTIDHGGASVRRENAELIRVSLSMMSPELPRTVDADRQPVTWISLSRH